MIVTSRRSEFKPYPPRRRRYTNPYFQTRSSDRFIATTAKSVAARISPRGWLYIALAVVIIGALVWLSAFSSITRLQRVEVIGADNHDPLELERLAWYQSEERRFLLLSQEQLMLYKSSELRKALEDRFAFESIRVSKRFPNTLRVMVTEKQSAAVWFEADAYYQVDPSGWIISPLGGPLPGMPIVYNNGDARVEGKKVSNSEQVIAAATYLSQELPGRLSNLTIRQLVIDNERATLKAIFNPNVIVFFSTEGALSGQLDRLEILVKQELKDQFKKLSYVDLRYGEKVYYK